MAKKKISKTILKSGGNIPVVASAIVLVAFIVGLLVGTLLIAKSTSGKVGFITGGYAEGWNAAKKKVAEAGIFASASKGYLNGTVTKISGNEVAFSSVLNNPLDDEALKTRTAVIDSNTTISVYVLKSDEKFAADTKSSQAEMTDLQAQANVLRTKLSGCYQAMGATDVKEECVKMQKDYSDLSAKINQATMKADRYELVANAQAKDIKEGMQVSVTGKKSSANSDDVKTMGTIEDISNQLKFTAGSISARENFAPTAIKTGAQVAPVSTPIVK